MACGRWEPRRECTRQEEVLLRRPRRTRKLFAFLRDHREEIFDGAFQDELAAMYRDTGAGKDALPPASSRNSGRSDRSVKDRGMTPSDGGARKRRGGGRGDHDVEAS